MHWENEMIDIETGSGKVYADLGSADADEMLVKAACDEDRRNYQESSLEPTAGRRSAWNDAAETIENASRPVYRYQRIEDARLSDAPWP